MDKAEVKTRRLKSAQASERFGRAIGRELRGGEVIELISDLGGGKTTLAKGIAKGAGSADHVTSPSFTIRNDYSANGIAIAHFDFYRLSDVGTLREMLAEVLTDPETAVLIEWAAIIDDVLPADHVKIRLISTSDGGRKLAAEYPRHFSYLFKKAF